VTLFLVNQQEERQGHGEPKDEVWVFQPKLRIRGADKEPIFCQRREAKADLSKSQACASVISPAEQIQKQ